MRAITVLRARAPRLTGTALLAVSVPPLVGEVLGPGACPGPAEGAGAEAPGLEAELVGPPRWAGVKLSWMVKISHLR